ncbi:glycosyltransferase family 4 protein [Hamadaea tsunoensis]|uniref:glycosyltransferase family 4 protein n=1 Tax=Hamadaea tsunoensis TaxID=53368 RepID=UPI0004190100|nr:glycosyltransferase family 1 protein [Hamadaea tsunoensis]
MRVAIITESYAPDVNGVANSVLRVAEHLMARGHKPLVIAPQPGRALRHLAAPQAYPVLRLPSLPMPGYRNVRLAGPSRLIKDALRLHRADVVHLASPFVLGAWGARAGAELGLPVVAVYQTDVPGYADAYGVTLAQRAAWRWIADIHGRASVTLAPSSSTADQLTEHGIPRVARWGRGVDTTLFHPGRRSADLRRELAPQGELIVGYVGRLAHEKRVELLRDASREPGVRVVVVGDGPTRKAVEKALPDAVFLGGRSGADLATIYASLDVFVHTGPHETFCQTIQEALASGVPVVAPASGGPLDLVEQGVTGFLVPAYDSAAIAHAVTALADPEVRQRFGLAARLAVADRSWAALGDQLISHYRAALGRRARELELVP